MTRSSFSSDKSPKSLPDLEDTACQDGRNAWHPARSSNSTKETTVSGTPWLCGSKKPLLRPQTVKAKLRFARQHYDWTVEQWNNVLWSDESSFQLFYGAKRAFGRRRKGERFSPQCIVPTVRHGGLP